MLFIADSVGNFWFSDDAEFQAQDPHAYWLMNRMMRMIRLIKTADDGWTWMLDCFYGTAMKLIRLDYESQNMIDLSVYVKYSTYTCSCVMGQCAKPRMFSSGLGIRISCINALIILMC